MFCIKFRFGVRLLFFKKLWPAFQPSKALVGRNGKADVFCSRRKTVFDLMYDSYIRILGISLHLQDASCCCHNINTAKTAVQPFGRKAAVMKLGSRFIATLLLVVCCGVTGASIRETSAWSLVSIRFGSIDMQKTIIELFKRN